MWLKLKKKPQNFNERAQHLIFKKELPNDLNADTVSETA
jgi:hypothetical protein